MSKSPSRTDPENVQFIHQRYEDAALVIFRQDQKRFKDPLTYLTFGESSKHYAYSCYGNASVIVKKSGRDVTKLDEKSIQSAFCTIL